MKAFDAVRRGRVFVLHEQNQTNVGIEMGFRIRFAGKLAELRALPRV